MRFLSVGFSNFRNLENSMVVTSEKEVLLTGSNGQGKTNFLEALYVLCYGSSFRTNNIRELIAHGEKEFTLSALIENRSGLRQRLSFRFSSGKREILIDGRIVRDRKELLYNIPCIVFSHDDIEFIRGEPQFRRKFFDQTMAMYDMLFFDDLRRYRAVLRQRNAAIKGEYRQLLPLYNEQLATFGLRLQKLRQVAVDECNKVLPEVYRRVSMSDTDIVVKYRPSWKNCLNEQDIVNILENNIERDIKMQTTTSGVHRDQFIIVDGKGPFVASGSTGQLRLVSLIFRLVQSRLYLEKTGQSPLLLIDDVLLELDQVKREAFLQELGSYSQAFFTFLPQEHYSSHLQSESVCRYRVQEGRFIADV